MSTLCSEKTCRHCTKVAAYNGHIKCLQHAHNNGVPWHPETTLYASIAGRKKCLEYAHKNGCPWYSYTTRGAATHNQKECLQYAHDNGCYFHPLTTWSAAVHGHVDCLIYIYEKCGIKWEDTYLEYDLITFPENTQNYIKMVMEDWKAGLNQPGMRTKSVKKK